jgi:hypothetical protein
MSGERGTPARVTRSGIAGSGERWTAHLWVLMPPIAAIVIGYVLWTLWMMVLSLKLPPWLLRFVHLR